LTMLSPKRPSRIPVICTLWILVAIWLAICFGLSSQTGEETGKLSLTIARFVAAIFNLADTSVVDINSWLRTLAHIACFFVLSGLMSGACATTFSTHFSAFAWPLLPCVFFAFLDEIRKSNIPGRHCSIPEAWLNTLGCILGCALTGAILWAVRQRRNRRRVMSRK
jgi:VanZ family protein